MHIQHTLPSGETVEIKLTPEQEQQVLQAEKPWMRFKSYEDVVKEVRPRHYHTALGDIATTSNGYPGYAATENIAKSERAYVQIRNMMEAMNPKGWTHRSDDSVWVVTDDGQITGFYSMMWGFATREILEHAIKINPTAFKEIWL